jgi:hypothetical protein
MQVDKATAETLTKDVAADIVPGRASYVDVQKNMQNPILGNMSMNTATNMRVENTIID